MSITESSMLVELNMSLWTGIKTDRTVTDKVNSDANAARDAGKFKKNLLAGSSLRKEIEEFAGACRRWHYARTVPWSDNGPRLLPTSLFLDYKSEANARRDTFNYMADRLAKEFPDLVNRARSSLGSLFDPADYPSADEVRGKFDFRLVFSPVPSSGDFRVDVPMQALEELKSQYESSFDSRLAEAMREPWERLRRMLTTMSEKLVEPDEDGPKRRFYDSFTGNAEELCGMLKHLNLTNDPKLEEARVDLQRALKRNSIDDIREDAGVRASVKSDLDAILNKFEW